MKLLLVELRASIVLADTTLLPSVPDALLGPELLEGDGGQDGGAVVLGLDVVGLVNGDGGVNVLVGEDLLVKNGLDVLVDVVVDVLAADLGTGVATAGGLVGDGGVLEAGGLSSELVTDGLPVAVIDCLMLDADEVVGVLVGEVLRDLDRLNDGVVVVLVDLLVKGVGDLLVLVGADVFIRDDLEDGLIDRSVVFPVVGNELDDLLVGVVGGAHAAGAVADAVGAGLVDGGHVVVGMGVVAGAGVAGAGVAGVAGVADVADVAGAGGAGGADTGVVGAGAGADVAGLDLVFGLDLRVVRLQLLVIGLGLLGAGLSLYLVGLGLLAV